jgi:hypothetical protein
MSSQAFRRGGGPFPLLKGVLGAAVALAALSLSTGSAQAACAPGTPAGTCRVTVGGLQYDVTTFTGNYNGNSSKFQTPANGGKMPWWGSGETTWTFMQAVGANEGDFYGSLGISPIGNTILFAYEVTDTPQVIAKEYSDGPSGSSAVNYSDTLYGSNTIYWAQAAAYTPPPVDAPGPLPLFGAGAAFGFGRRLRKRIQGARQPLASSQPRA